MAKPTRVPHLSLNWCVAADFVVTRGQGSELFTADGRRALDFLSGIGVVSTGHCHPSVVKAVKKQAGQLIHSQSYLGLPAPLVELARRLAAKMPAGIDTFFFCNSGAEAVEAAIRLARSATGRSNVIAFQGGFHGRTAGAMSLSSSNATYRAGALPFTSGVSIAPFPRAFHHRISDEEASERSLLAVREMLQTQTRPDHTAAILVEPIQGEAGLIPAPEAFLHGLRSMCDEHGILLVVDEIQTGFGRTGRMLAIEHAGVRPDIVTLGKGMASGFPIAVMGASEELMDRVPYGSQGGTFNGNPVACAAALATMDVFDAENLLQRAQEQGAYLAAALRKLKGRFGPEAQTGFSVADVRGRGLMIGVELTRRDGSPATEEAAEVVSRCKENGVILIASSPTGNVIRWMPPLTVRREEIDEAVAVFEEALQSVGQIEPSPRESR